MDKQAVQMRPQQILNHAKKHPHSISVSTQAFSLNKRDYVVHNVSMKADPTNDFQVANYRRGLAFIQQIIDFKQQNLRVGKKGLRKFYDLIPEYLNIKTTHISHSKYFTNLKAKLLDSLKVQSSTSYTIYSTQKANGENAQISYDAEGGFWIIGSKNKTLLLAELKDIKYITHKYEHVRTISIAEQWFKILQSHPDQVQSLKHKLSQFVLVGEICDSQKSGHIVDYGQQIKLFFYALVSKEQQDYSCEPPSLFLQFIQQNHLQNYCVKFNTIHINTYEALIEQLKAEMYKIYEGDLEKYGQGTVLYITRTNKEKQDCASVFKVKTLQYRIYRKLREKLKAYFQKYRKTYDKMLNKFIEQVKQLTKGFKTPKNQEYYFNVAKRAFMLSEDQEKAVSKFFHNKYIGFLKLAQNQKVDKDAFKKIIHQSLQNNDIIKLVDQKFPVDEVKVAQNENKLIESNIEEKIKEKKVFIFMGLTIPASGKSTLFNKIANKLQQMGTKVSILSSDTTRAQKMNELIKQKKMPKQKAYQKSLKSANKQYYDNLNQIIKVFESQHKTDQFVLFLDKNHVQNSFNKTIQEINKACKNCKKLKLKIVAILPKCQTLMANKPKYMYPFSSCYIANCLKRVLSRQTHQTLQGTQIHRANILMGFANMFRNFAISNYNLSRYFDSVITIPFTKEQELPQQITQKILKILLGTKPGSFDEHPSLYQLVQIINKWTPDPIDFDNIAQATANEIQQMFLDFYNIKVDVSKFVNTQSTKVDQKIQQKQNQMKQQVKMSEQQNQKVQDC